MKPSGLSITLAGSSPDNGLARVIGMAPAPVLMGEDEADYAGLAARVVGVSGPRDALEELLLRDVIDLTWEILRLRRLKAGLLRASMSAGVSQVLETVGYPYFESERLSQDWAAGAAKARKQVDAVLTGAGLSMEEATAKTFERKIEVFEQIDRMQASAEARRNNALREIDRHREAAGAAARRAIDEVEDVEFREVGAGEAGAGHVA